MLAIYRACLRLYPGEFRDEYGRELSLVRADRLRDESSAAGFPRSRTHGFRSAWIRPRARGPITS
jgi:hypothetical protein